MSNSNGNAGDGEGDINGGDGDVVSSGNGDISGDDVSSDVSGGGNVSSDDVSGDGDVSGGNVMSDDDNLPERVGKNRNAFLLPVLAEDEEWQLCPTKMRIHLTSDHSSAAENGVRAAFGPQFEIFRADCTFHAGPAYWSKTHGELFTSRVASEQKYKVKLMNSDFELLKNCPFPELIPTMKEEMVIYWKDKKGRNELKLADAWLSVYSDSNLSRVLLVEQYSLRGGMPADNNIMERSNRNDKHLRNHTKKGPISFIRETVAHVQAESKTVKDFYGKMKSNVHSGAFMANIWRTCAASENNVPCMLNVQFNIVATAKGIPAGSVIVPKYRTINKLQQQEHQRIGRTTSLTVQECKDMLNQNLPGQGPWSMVETYRQLVREPTRWMKHWKDEPNYQPHMGFERLREWTSVFCCLRPINAEVNSTAVDSLRTILTNHGYTVIELDAIKAMRNKGFVSCDCSTYLHYAWCYHAGAVAFSRGVITDYPPTMNPNPAFGNSKRGRPKKTVIGGALGRV